MLWLWLIAMYPMQADVKAMLRNGEVEAARQTLEDVLCSQNLLAEDHVEALLDLAEIELLHRGKPQLALARLHEVKSILKDPSSRLPGRLHARYFYLLGMTQERLGAYPEAAEAFQTVALRFPKSPWASQALEGAGRVFRKTYEGWLARVERTPITEIDVEETIQALPPIQQARYQNPEARQQLLEGLIDQELLYRAALDEGFLARADVQEALEQQKRRILVQTYLNEKVRKNVTVSESEIREAYQRFKDQFRVPPTAIIRKVVVTDSIQAHKLWEKVLQGTSLDSLGLHVSEDRIRKNTQPKPLAHAAFSSPPGKPAMVHVGKTWVIFNVIKVEPERIRSLEEVRSFLEGRIKASKIRARERDLLQDLRSRYSVQYNTKALKESDR